MEHLLLSREERIRFIKYLEQENFSDKGLLEQHAKLGLGPMHEVYARRQNTLIAARQIVINDLMRIEDESIGPSEVGEAKP